MLIKNIVRFATDLYGILKLGSVADKSKRTEAKNWVQDYQKSNPDLLIGEIHKPGEKERYESFIGNVKSILSSV